jgi:hypothetical protein
MSERDNNLAKIVISVPEGFRTRTSLSYGALDARSRELARSTRVLVEGRVLLTQSFRLNAKGNLVIELLPEAFQIVHRERGAAATQ